MYISSPSSSLSSIYDEICYVLRVYVYVFNRVQKELVRYSGRQLFGMSKAVLERMFGADEGGRLYSQLLVQKNLSGVCFIIYLFFFHFLSFIYSMCFSS